MKKEEKLIFHIDLNAFYCQCEQNENPLLKNVPFAVAPNDNTYRGIISTSNYIARKYGVFSAMSVQDAIKKCPYLRLVSPNFRLYKKYSETFFSYLKTYSSKIQIASIDECYIDLSDNKMKNEPLLLASKIQTELLNKYRLSASIGISNSLFLAKMASDYKKPLGITIIDYNNLDILDNLFIKSIYGIGKKVSEKLNSIGIVRISDFKNEVNKDRIIEIIGKDYYDKKIAELNGKGSNLVVPNEGMAPKSITHETTLSNDIASREILIDYLTDCFNSAYSELKKYKMNAVSIVIKYKLSDFSQKTKQSTLDNPTDDYDILYQSIISLFDDLYKDFSVRLIGCGFSKIILKNHKDYNLFNYEMIQKENKLKETIENLDIKLKNTIKKI